MRSMKFLRRLYWSTVLSFLIMTPVFGADFVTEIQNGLFKRTSSRPSISKLILRPYIESN